SVVHAMESHAFGVDAPIDHSAGARALQCRAYWQPKNGAGVQLEFVLPLGDHGDHPRVMGPWADLTEPDLIAANEQLYTEYALPAKVFRHGTRDVLRLFKCGGVHGMRLPTF